MDCAVHIQPYRRISLGGEVALSYLLAETAPECRAIRKSRLSPYNAATETTMRSVNYLDYHGVLGAYAPGGEYIIWRRAMGTLPAWAWHGYGASLSQ